MVLGVSLLRIPEDKKATVIKELKGYIAQLHTIKSKVMGGFLGDMIVPPCVAIPHDQVLKLREATTPEFVLCDNDLGQHNIMVDETTLKITAILDWEYALWSSRVPFTSVLDPPSLLKGKKLTFQNY